MRKYPARKSNYILSPSIDRIDGTIKREKIFKFFLKNFIFVQQKPLNVITLGQSESDNINRMVTITDCFYLVLFNKWDT